MATQCTIQINPVNSYLKLIEILKLRRKKPLNIPPIDSTAINNMLSVKCVGSFLLLNMSEGFSSRFLF